jgi:hypothetical protein
MTALIVPPVVVDRVAKISRKAAHPGSLKALQDHYQVSGMTVSQDCIIQLKRLFQSVYEVSSRIIKIEVA